MFLIVHAGTETILNAHECLIVDIDSLDDYDTALVNDGDESDLVEVAKRCGRAVVG